jgi:hypothetical protein
MNLGSVYDDLGHMIGGVAKNVGHTTTNAIPQVVDDSVKVASALSNAAPSGFRDSGRQIGGRLMDQFGSGWGVARQAGKHALRGAVVGGAIGGTQDWAQGGSFWTGAKSGAFNGAVGWSAYRMAGHAVGATSLNPFSKDGAPRMVSNQVKAILKNKADAFQAAKANGLKL